MFQGGIKEIKSELDGHLREQRKRLGCSDADYWHSAKEKYQIQVPERYFSKNRQVRRYAVVHFVSRLAPYRLVREPCVIRNFF